MIGYDRFVVASAALGPHVHQGAYEVCYIVSGAVEWWAGDEVTEVGPGHVYITRPGEPHGGTHALMHPCELYWVQIAFPLPGLDPADAKQIESAIAALKLRTFSASDAVKHCCRRMLDEHAINSSLSHIVVRTALHEFLVQIIRDHQTASTRPRTSSVQAAIAWMDAHLAEDYTVEEAAAAAGLRVSRFHERFVAETGFTPAEYRTRQRVRWAKQLLRSPDAFVTDVAMTTGFSTSQYFATVFKNLVGLSPREYAKAARGR